MAGGRRWTSRFARWPFPGLSPPRVGVRPRREPASSSADQEPRADARGPTAPRGARRQAVGRRAGHRRAHLGRAKRALAAAGAYGRRCIGWLSRLGCGLRCWRKRAPLHTAPHPRSTHRLRISPPSERLSRAECHGLGSSYRSVLKVCDPNVRGPDVALLPVQNSAESRHGSEPCHPDQELVPSGSRESGVGGLHWT